MLSVYSFLIGSSQICSSSVGRTVYGVGDEEVASDAAGVVRGLVECTTCLVWIICPLRVSSASEKYLVAWVCVMPGHKA